MAARRILLFIKSLGAVGHKDPPEEELTLLHSELWNLGPPPMGDPLHSETWTLKEQPSFTLLHSEAWSS